MSRAIATLLNKPESLVTNVVRKLEDMNGSPSEDVRLLAENLQKLRLKSVQLGLDPNDTTSQELYHGLQAKFAKDSKLLERAIGINEGASNSERSAKAVQLLKSRDELPETWVLKHSTAKSLLRQAPPKKLMKKLNYHSLESMLKRENVDNIYLAASCLESAAWHSSINKKISKLGSADFEMRPISIASLPENYYKGATGPSSYMVSDKNLGTVALWPNRLPQHINVLALAAAIVGAIEKLNVSDPSSSFYELNPALRWWADNSNLVSNYDSEPVSLNIKDTAHDFLNGRSYEQRTNKHAAKALFNTLLSRYQNQSDKIAGSLKDLGYNLNTENDSGRVAPLGAQLAAEYAGTE